MGTARAWNQVYACKRFMKLCSRMKHSKFWESHTSVSLAPCPSLCLAFRFSFFAILILLLETAKRQKAQLGDARYIWSNHVCCVFEFVPRSGSWHCFNYPRCAPPARASAVCPFGNSLERSESQPSRMKLNLAMCTCKWIVYCLNRINLRRKEDRE